MTMSCVGFLVEALARQSRLLTYGLTYESDPHFMSWLCFGGAALLGPEFVLHVKPGTWNA